MSTVRLRHLLCVAIMACGIAPVQQAVAQYTRLPYGASLLDASGNLNDRARKAAYGKKMGVLRGGFDAAAKAAIDTWLKEYQFRRLTRLEAESELPTIVGEIVDDVARSEGDVKNYILSTTLNTMVVIANDKQYSPAARINAMNLIGELNQVERGAKTGAVPKPYAPALRHLRNALVANDQIDGVRLSALLGLKRHVESQWPLQSPMPPAAVKVLLADAQKIVDAKDPPAGKSRAGNDWLRMRALELMTALNTPGENDSVFKTLYRVASDTDNQWFLRCAAADCMGRMELSKSKSITEPQYAATLKLLGAMAAELCEEEANRLEAIKSQVLVRKEAFVGLDKGIGGAGGASIMGGAVGEAPGMGEEGAGMEDPGMSMPMGGGMMGGLPGMSRPRVIPLSYQDTGRRRVMARMLRISQGINGATSSSSKADKTRNGVAQQLKADEDLDRAKRLNDAMKSLLGQLTQKELPLEDIVSAYRQASNELAVIADMPPPAEEALAPSPADPGGAAPVPGGAAPVPDGAAAAPVPDAAAAPVPDAAAPVPDAAAAPGPGAAVPAAPVP